MKKAISAAATFQAQTYDTRSIGRKCGYRIGTDLYENCTWICHWQTAGLTKEKNTGTAPRFLTSTRIM